MACDIKSRRLAPTDVDDPDSLWPGQDASAPLDHDQMKLYQSVGALVNFVAMDRPDLFYSIKEVMRFMSKPTEDDMVRLKRVVRYLRTVPRWAAVFPWHTPSNSIEVFTDSDHAGSP